MDTYDSFCRYLLKQLAHQPPNAIKRLRSYSSPKPGIGVLTTVTPVQTLGLI